jgi:hypothetical protein
MTGPGEEATVSYDVSSGDGSEDIPETLLFMFRAIIWRGMPWKKLCQQGVSNDEAIEASRGATS